MRIKLSTRLILLVLVLQFFMLLLLVWDNSRIITDQHADMFVDRLHTGNRLLTTALTPGLVNNDKRILQDTLKQFTSLDNLVYAQLKSPQGDVLLTWGDAPTNPQVDNNYQAALTDGVFDMHTSIRLEGNTLGNLHSGYLLSAVAGNQKTSLPNLSSAVPGLLVILLASLLLAFYFMRDLRKLENGAKALATDHRTHTGTATREEETKNLAATVNQLTQDLHETKQALRKEHDTLERETHFMQALLDGIDAVVMEARPPGYHFTFVSREAQNLMGYPVSDWLKPQFWSSHVCADDREWVENTIATHTEKGESFTLDFRLTHRQGHDVWVRAINSVELDEDENPIMRGLILDITEQKTAEDRIVYLAEHDPLTGLINRRRFQKELERAISYAQRYQQQGAILFVDLDQFKYVNDTYGHQYGDEYLLDVSRRLSQALRRTDILGRLGGDEFGIIIPKCSHHEANTVGTALLSALSQETLEHDGSVVPVSASIGIALFPEQSAIPSDLLAKADAAMYTAKRNGRGQVHIFRDDDAELWNMQAKIHWEERIRWALTGNHFELYYQPVVQVDSGLITHYEVLLRMLGEKGEVIAPGAFIETAERFGLIGEVDRWVVDKAIKAQADSIKNHRPISLAINLSGRHFGNDKMLAFIHKSIENYGANPQSLMFEVTETEAVENLSKARNFIDALRGIGCKFALDDFGIGFSSFHYLRNLPVDYIKIDGSFVRNLHTDEDDRLFVKAIVDLARGLKISCVAEFVENNHIIEILLELGVELGQGYYIAKPAPAFIDGQILDISKQPHA